MSSALVVASWTFITDLICAGILGSTLWDWSSMKASARGRLQRARPDHPVDDPEQLERVGRAHHEVVIGVEAAVEVEVAEAEARSSMATMNPRELRGAGGRCLPPPWPGERARGSAAGGCPSRERRCCRTTAETVPSRHPLGFGEPGIDGRQGVGQPVLPTSPAVVGARRVTAAGHATGSVDDVDALEQVVTAFLPTLGVGLQNAAELSLS